MDKIDKEINAVADKMEKSINYRAQLKATIIDLGPEKLRKAVLNLSESKQALLAEILKEMAMEKADLEGMDMEKEMLATLDIPAGDGDTFMNTIKLDADAVDEMGFMEADAKDQAEHRNQGGVPIDGWQGEVIKSAAGEGSRGGKVIGHTASGDPIYEAKGKKHFKVDHAAEYPSDVYNKVTKLKENRYASKKDAQAHLDAHPELHGHKVSIEHHEDAARRSTGGGMIGGIAAFGHQKKVHSSEDYHVGAKAMKKSSDEYEMPKKEAVKEHKRLVQVLESDSHADDKVEAKKQKKELKEDIEKSEMDKCNVSEPLMKDGEAAAKASDKKMKAAEDDANKPSEMEKARGIPAGADKAKVESCVKDVKAQGHDKSSAFAICNAAGAGMKKGEMEMDQAKDKIMAMEQKEHGTKDPKKLVDAEKKEHAEDKKSKLKPMIARMQEKKMEKGICVSKLAAFTGAPADKIAQVWDLMEKAEKMLAEEDQAKASEMNANDVKHIDKPAARQPKAQAKNHTQMADGMVADMASETADEAIAAGEKMIRMAKSTSFFYDDSELDQFIPQKRDTLMAKSLGRNAHYNAEPELMADLNKALEDHRAEELFKSSAGKGPVRSNNINDLIEFGLDEDAIKYEDSIRVVEQTGTFFVKSFDEADLVETLQKGETWAEESALVKP